MRKCLILFLLTGLFTAANAQQNDEANVITTFTSLINADYSVCTDNAGFPAFLLKEVNTYLEKDTILRLSPGEKQELQNKLLAAQHAPQWQGSTVNGIPLIKNDSVKKVMGDSAKVWEYFKKKYPQPIRYALYTFSRPVFIRNNTVCLFYFDEGRYGGIDPWNHEENSSSGELSIYIKKGDTWIKRIIVFHYIT